MSWQDLVLTAGSIAFLIALLPSVLSDDKPARATSLLTGAVLLVFAGVYASLELWFTTVVTTATGLLWLTLFVQKLRQKRS